MFKKKTAESEPSVSTEAAESKETPMQSLLTRIVGWVDYAAAFIQNRDSEDPDNTTSVAHGPIKFGLITFAIVFGGFGLWSAFAPLESAAIANGVVVLHSNKKVIQHLEGGIIEEILVTDGQMVESGQPLIKLSRTAAQARQDLISGQYYSARATEARLQAERDLTENLIFPTELTELSDPKVKEILDSQARLFEARRNAIVGKIDVLQQRIEQFNDEIGGLRSQAKAVRSQLALIKEEAGVVEKLLASGNAMKPRLLNLQRKEAELEGQRGEYLALIARAEQSITQTEVEIINIKNEHVKEVVDSLREAQEQIAQLQEQYNAAKDVLDRIVIVAPQSGEVTGLRFHTRGGVIGPREPIMDLVPKDDELIVEAKVSPGDIDVVHQGLPARVRLTAYKTRKIPPIEAEVTYVSADRFIDEATGQGYFLAKIHVDPAELDMLDEVELYPGMPAEVLIVTGANTVLAYLMQPISDSFYRAFREQ